ncbi:Rhomboid-like protein [Plasmodium coatneyi]|uniref:Rhomboid-like protein n=1 Tax=Plasmodium coatneyi TaxID=208452 RepID=A0A1B1E0G9_9APIC|nr:Rhomboid-like protein [Plasmodium coatneyi]ANQ08518.1 Rhomboid-like protein [Plasmodium coatneyi]
MKKVERYLSQCGHWARGFSRYSHKQPIKEKKRSQSILGTMRGIPLRNMFPKWNDLTMEHAHKKEKEMGKMVKRTFEELRVKYEEVRMKYQDTLSMWRDERTKIRKRIAPHFLKGMLMKNVAFDGRHVKTALHKISLEGKFFLKNLKHFYRDANIPYYRNLIHYHYRRAPVTYTLMSLHLLVFLLWMSAKPGDTYNYVSMPRGFYYPSSNVYTPFGVKNASSGQSFPFGLFNFLTTEFMYNHFCCGPQQLREKKLYTLITNLISHNTVQSLLLNTISLFYIGRSFEMIINSRNFFLTYFISGMISSYVQICYHKSGRSSSYGNVCVLGASGSISSILTTYTLMFPSSSIYLYGVLGLPLALFTSLYCANEVYCVLTDKNDNTGHVAHLTGMFLGMLYYYFYVKGRVAF